MGDLITELPVDKTAKISESDIQYVQDFFDTTVSFEEEKPKIVMEMFKFVGIFALIFYACVHPASIGRFVQNPIYKPIIQTIVFAAILFLYLYIF